MTRAPKAVRATLKALWREFRRCSQRYPPLYHEVVDYPEALRVQLSQYDVLDVCKSYRQGFAEHFNEDWECWHGPDDVAFLGRFFGNSEGIEEFTEYAESAYWVISAIDPGDYYVKNSYDSGQGWGYHGWLKLLHEMAIGYPTPLLRMTGRIVLEEYRPAYLATPESEGVPYPADVCCLGLAHSVFTSSMAAIEIILNDSNALLIGEDTTGIPISFSEPSGKKPVRHLQQTPESGQPHSKQDTNSWPTEPQKHLFLPPILEFYFDGAWHLQFDTGNNKETGSFPKTKGFEAYRMLLSQPNIHCSAPDLLQLQGRVVLGAEKSGPEIIGEEGRTELDREIEQLKHEFEDCLNPGRQQELLEELEGLSRRKNAARGRRGWPRTMPTVGRLHTKRLHGQFKRIRDMIRREMPIFAEYLGCTVPAEGGDFSYRPDLWTIDRQHAAHAGCQPKS